MPISLLLDMAADGRPDRVVAGPRGKLLRRDVRDHYTAAR
jgi:hypothetical protein